MNLVAENTFCLAHDSGDSLYFNTKIFDNGDWKGRESQFTNQEIVFQGNFNSVKFNLVGIRVTPERLRELADKLEKMGV